MRKSVLVAAVCLCSALQLRAAPRGMTPEDTYRLQVPAQLEISPDGRTAAVVLESALAEQNSHSHTLWLVPVSGEGEWKQVGPKAADVSHPRFSRSGALAFLVSRGEGPQLWVAKPGSTRGKRITQLEEGVEGYDWSPDGTQFVVVRTDPQTRTPEQLEHEPIVIKRTQIQADGSGFLDERRSHLWIVAATGRSEPRRLTSGAYDDGQPAWSPDGKSIAFVSNRTPDPDTNDNTEIFAIAPDGTGLRTLAANAGPDGFPTWSHRGDKLAFVGQLRVNDFYQVTRVMTVAAEGGTPCDLSGHLDNWIAADSLNVSSVNLARLNFSPDDSALITTFDRRGANYLASIDLVRGDVKELFGGAALIGLPRLTPDGQRLVYAQEDATHPPELFIRPLAGGETRRLSHWHDGLLAEVKLSTPQKLTVKNAAGDSVESWLYPPLDPEPGKKYPLVLYIHGGPQGFDGDYFDVGLENQIFPAHGMAVLRVNYRGSTSYGEAFCHSLWGDWHWREYEDLMLSVDAAIATGWVDPGRLGLGGWSYGGIMTIWTVGHTDRFKLGVPERFEVDYLSCFGQDQWFAQYLAELGDPFNDAEHYRKLSPGSYADKIKTPLYLISNEKDGNCPLPQAMQFYQRLKHLGVPTELTIYPDEPHAMTQPKHIVDRLHRLLEWFGKL